MGADKKKQNLNKAEELKGKSIYLNFDLQKAESSDDDSREVWGIASAEVIDSYGDIVKHEAMKAAWDDYMKYANIREMHGPSAVGTVIDYEFLDDQKATFIKVKVVDDMAWEKVKEGVYKGFSIGARILDASWEVVDGKDYFAITKLELVEISLVDRPACPEANIDGYKFYSVTPKDMNLFKFLDKKDDEVKKNDEAETPETPEVPTEGGEETPKGDETPAENGSEGGEEKGDEAEKSESTELLKSISESLEVVKAEQAEQKTFNENLVKSLEGAFEQVFKSNDTESIKSQIKEIQKTVSSLKKADSAQKNDEEDSEETEKAYVPQFGKTYGGF